eukprot:TRINITY_DN431_c0_g1_i18.p1 TRINITY_DN431_c0_g1~~TRINITY_DN431_c0_g1_i18.p1  ORF type:complete len:268 (-),score=48.77 TRINITY_DN431_c0_g1_i18:56-859(-)
MFIAFICFGLFNFKLSKFYGLFPHKQTDPSCLVYSSMYTAKLAFPMCYNYLMIVSLSEEGSNGKLRTVFETVVGVMDLVPYLGLHFQRYFPCVLGLLLILNICQVYSRVMKSLSLDNYTFTLDVSELNYKLGLNYLNKELANMEGSKTKMETSLLSREEAKRPLDYNISIDPVLLERTKRKKKKDNVHDNMLTTTDNPASYTDLDVIIAEAVNKSDFGKRCRCYNCNRSCYGVTVLRLGRTHKFGISGFWGFGVLGCLLYTSPSPRD